jgi:hypothetical protein
MAPVMWSYERHKRSLQTFRSSQVDTQQVVEQEKHEIDKSPVYTVICDIFTGGIGEKGLRTIQDGVMSHTDTMTDL